MKKASNDNYDMPKTRYSLRIIVYILISIVLLSITFITSNNQKNSTLEFVKQQTISKSRVFSSEAELKYNRIYIGLERLKNRYTISEAVNANAWHQDASFLMDSVSGIDDILLTNQDLQIVHSQSDTYYAQEKITSLKNEDKINILLPITSGKNFEGFIYGLLNVEELIASMLVEIGDQYMVEISREDELLYVSDEWDKHDEEFTKRNSIVLQNAEVWNLAIAPTEAYHNTIVQRPYLIMVYGLLISFAILLLLYFFNNYFRNASMLAYKNRSEKRYKLVTENASDVIWVYNLTKDKFLFISPSIFALRGLSVDDAMLEKIQNTMTLSSYKKLIDLVEKTRKDLNRQTDKQDGLLLEVQLFDKSLKEIWVEMALKINYNRDGEVEITGVSRNVEKRKIAEQKIMHMHYHDYLTGLYNRRYFEEQMISIDKDNNLPVSIIIIDVNGLKLVNDSFGHVIGDQLLKKVSDILIKSCDPKDIVSRLSGDEFIVLIKNSNVEYVEKCIKNIRDNISTEEIFNIKLSVSIGYSTREDFNTDMNTLFQQAEDKMYQNKLYESSNYKSNTIDLITSTLYEKSKRELLHSKRVSRFCSITAVQMGFDQANVKRMELAGLMHDIGKIGIQEAILNKNDTLSANEWIEMKKHPEIGYRILTSSNDFAEIATYVLKHHERWDGKGYPLGLKEDETEIHSRIIAVADAFDAMTSDRTYRKGLSIDEAIDEITKGKGTQFDPFISSLFIKKCIPLIRKSTL
jgi:diguanylate cyclase (GGDEF)-like protein/PAS domain S-box-containing protein